MGETYNRRVTETLHTVPDGASDSLLYIAVSLGASHKLTGIAGSANTHRKGTSEIIDDNVRARVARVVHGWLMCVFRVVGG